MTARPDPRSPHRSSRLLLGCAALVLMAGCEPPPRPPINTADRRLEDRRLEDGRLEERQQDDATETRDFPRGGPLLWAGRAPEELWDAYFQGFGSDARQIGYSQMEIGTSAEPEADRVGYRTTERLLVPVDGNIEEQILVHEFVERDSGQLLRFTADFQRGTEEATAEGTVKNRQLVIEVAPEDQPTTRALPWNDEIGGFLALHQQLYEQPLAPGDERSLRLLVPMLFQLGRIDLRAIGQSSIPMLDDRTVSVTEIEVNTRSDQQQASSQTIWVDESGEILKQFMPAQQLQIFRTTAERACLVESPVPGLVETVEVPLQRPVDQNKPLAGLAFAISARQPDVDPTSWVATGPGQLVLPTDRDGKLPVASVRFDNAKAASRIAQAYPGPSPADSQPSPLVGSALQEIQRLASGAADEDPLQRVRKLAGSVRNALEPQDNPDLFASARAALQRGRGDRTEHALLMAAVCRASDLPARVAAGLVLDRTRDTLRFGMWTVVFADGGWIAVDAFQEDPLATNDRLTIAIDRLSTFRTDFGLFKRVQRALDALQIELLEARYRDDAETP